MAGARPPGVQGGPSSVSETDAGTLYRGSSPAPGPVDPSQAPLTPEQQALIVDVAQIALDIVGIVDPTPIADATNAAISVARSDWTGAGISLLGIIPFAGDAAKAGKLPRWLATVDKCIAQAKRSQRFANLLRPLLTRVYYTLDCLPLGTMSKSLRDTLKKLQGRIASIIGVEGRAARAMRLISGLRTRVDDPDMLLDAIEVGLQRGTVGTASSYVDDTLAYISREVANFKGKPRLRITKRTEYGGRASDTFAGQRISKEPGSGRILVGSKEGDEILPATKAGHIADKSVHPERIADEQGGYLVPIRVQSDTVNVADRGASAILHTFNAMDLKELQKIPAGSVLLEGKASSQSRKIRYRDREIEETLPGGGEQVLHLGQWLGNGFVGKRAEREAVSLNRSN
jgi:hypothetical protein